MRAISIALLLGIICAFSAGAAPEPTKEEKPRAASPNEVEVHFNNRSTVRMLILQERLEVQTAYGKLSVPCSDVQRIEFGMHQSAELRQKIDQSIKQLGSDTFKVRETAVSELVALGAQAYPALKVASKSTDPEVARKADAALKLIRDKVPADDLTIKDHDVVHTVRFTIAGTIENASLKARSEYFGDLDLKVGDLRGLRSLAAGSAEAMATVDASKYGMPEEAWLDTGMTVSADMLVKFAASGQVDLRPDIPGRFTSGPAGSRRAPNNQGPPGGALLGRIGESGAVFTIGEKYELKPTQEGKLYLRIAPSPYENSTGSYTVKISTGN